MCYPDHSYFVDFTSKKYSLWLSFRQNNIWSFFCNLTLVLQRLLFCNYYFKQSYWNHSWVFVSDFLFTFVREKLTFSTRHVPISWKKLVPIEWKSSFFIGGIKVCMKNSFKLIEKKSSQIVNIWEHKLWKIVLYKSNFVQ